MSKLRVSWPALDVDDGRKSLDSDAFARRFAQPRARGSSPPSLRVPSAPVYVVAPQRSHPVWLVPALGALIAIAVAATVAVIAI